MNKHIASIFFVTGLLLASSAAFSVEVLVEEPREERRERWEERRAEERRARWEERKRHKRHHHRHEREIVEIVE